MNRATVFVTLASLAACAPAYERMEDRPPARAGEGSTIIGQVGIDGRVVADTLSGALQDTARAERETVYAGVVATDPRPADTAGHVTMSRETGPWRVQVYASREEASAAALARRLEAESGAPAHVEREGGWYRVRLGGYPSRGEAEALRRRLVERGHADAFVVRAP